MVAAEVHVFVLEEGAYEDVVVVVVGWVEMGYDRASLVVAGVV